MNIGGDAGLDRVGVASADPFPEVRRDLETRIEDGSSGGLTFTFNHPERSTDIRRSLPWAQSLVVGAKTYLPQSRSPVTRDRSDDGRTGRIARFMTGTGYQELRAGLSAMAEALTVDGARAEVVADDNRLVDRAAAVRAGIGWWGKNSMVLVPGLGPWCLLGSVVTDRVLQPSTAEKRSCGACQACLPACPTGALIAPGVLDARKCLAAALQQPGPIPEWMRSVVGDRIYGCDDCLEACPPGKRLLELSVPDDPGVEIAWLLTAADDEILERFNHLYLPRRRPDVLRRNALTVVGNLGHERAVELIAPYLDNPDVTLAEHARWAWDRLGLGDPPRAAQRVASGK